MAKKAARVVGKQAAPKGRGREDDSPVKAGAGAAAGLLDDPDDDSGDDEDEDGDGEDRDSDSGDGDDEDLDDLDDDDWDDGDGDDDSDDDSDSDDDWDYDDDGDDLAAHARVPVAMEEVEGPGPSPAPGGRRNTGFTGKLESEAVPFPTPKAKKFTNWKDFREYWVSLWDDPQFRSRIRIYGYRMFPVMLKGHNQVCKLTGDAAEPHLLAKPLTLSDILHRWGAGGYSFRLNDAGGLRGQKEVCMHVLDPLKHPELMDYDTHAPVVEIGNIDPDNPNNASYIRQMKSKGKWGSEQEEEETMKALELLERQLEKGNQTAPSPGDKASIDLMAHSAKAAIDMVRESASQQGRSGQDGISLVTAVLGMVKEMQAMNQPRGDGDSQWVKLFMEAKAAEAQAQRENAKMMTDMAMAIVQQGREQARAKESDDDGETGPLKRLREMAELKALLKDIDLFGGGRRNPAPGTDWGEIMGKVLPMALPLLNTAAQAFAAWGQRNGAQITPPQIQAPQLQPQPAAMGNPAGGATAPGPSPSPEDMASIPEDFQSPEAVERFLASIKDPLLRYINDPERDGYSFADWYIDWKGEDHYEQLASIGVDNLLTVLSSYPPIWGELYSREAKVREFLEQFVSTPEDGDDGEGEAQGDNLGHVPYQNGHAPNPYFGGGAPVSVEPADDRGHDLEPEVSPLVREYAKVQLRTGGKAMPAAAGDSATPAKEAKPKAEAKSRAKGSAPATAHTPKPRPTPKAKSHTKVAN